MNPINEEVFFKGDKVSLDGNQDSILEIIQSHKGQVFAQLSRGGLIPVEKLRLVERCETYYGDSQYGSWHCSECGAVWFPRQLWLEQVEWPFLCQDEHCCGELIYEEAK